MSRKVILGAGLSLDGYVSRLDGSVDFLFMPDDYPIGEFFASLGAIVYGRKTHDAARSSNEKYEGPTMPTYVFSRHEPPGERDGVTFVNESPAAWAVRMKREPGGDIFHMGGGELARSFLEDDAVDELHIGIVPLLLGAGRPFFPPGFPERRFSLLDAKTYKGGLVTLRYQRARGV